MAIIYKKLSATKPIRSDVAVTGATFVSLGGYNNDTNSDSYKYGQYAETKTDYYYSKDDDNLKAVVAKVTITATDAYKAAQKIDYISSTKTFTVGGTDTVEYDGAEYTWKATGTTAGAGAWEDEDGNPVSFNVDMDDDLLDATIVVTGTTYTKNYLWVKNVLDNVAANAAAPTTQTEGTGTLNAGIATNLTGNKLLSKDGSVSAEGNTGILKFVLTDANGDHEGKEVNVGFTIFVSALNEYNAVLTFNVASNDYELAQALAAMDEGDALDLTTLAIS